MDIDFPAMKLGDLADALPGEIEERPPGYAGPDLSPSHLQLEPRQIGQGVFALLARPVPRDNSGVIFGSRAALVVDAGVTPSVGRAIEDAARALTDRPVEWLVNTTYHGDHSFGNAAFPREVHVVSSRLNALSMRDLEKEKRVRSRNMYGDAVLDEVREWRAPDVKFEHFLELDLGGIDVQLWQFGPGNAPGDTVVYVPRARAAWTGNFLGHRGIAPMLLEGGPRPYAASLRRMKAALALDVIVPGHGPMDAGGPAIDWMISYLDELDRDVRKARAEGQMLERILEARPPIPPPRIAALPPQAASGLAALNRQMDRLNVLATFRDLERHGAS
jgi:cyclase